MARPVDTLDLINLRERLIKLHANAENQVQHTRNIIRKAELTGRARAFQKVLELLASVEQRSAADSRRVSR